MFSLILKIARASLARRGLRSLLVILMIGISALEILVAGIQAYVFALLTSLYINDAEHLH